MTHPVWVLDTTWDPIELKKHQKLFPFLQVLQSKRDILKQIRKLSKTGISCSGGFYFVHQSDVLEESEHLDDLLRNEDFALFSGASAGSEECVHPRSKIKRQLTKFLQYWKDGDPQSARRLLKQDTNVRKIDRIRLWIDRVQHDYINLLAPLDLLAISFSGGEIDEATYEQSRDKLIRRMRDKITTLLSQRATDLGGLAGVFKEAETLFDDPLKTTRTTKRPENDRLTSYLGARILHIDDEIDNGWDLVMPLLFGDRYASESDLEKVPSQIAELENQGDPFIVLLDLGLTSGDSHVPKTWRGLNLLRDIRKQSPVAPIHVFSARDNVETYRQVLEDGASGFIRKPCRVLLSKDDVALYSSFCDQMLTSRYDIFRYFLYRAFDVIQKDLKSGSGTTPFKDQNDPKWMKRRRNLLIFLEELKSADLERSTRDRDYSAMAMRDLILALYRPFEREIDAGRPESYKTRLLCAYRNECAHAGGGRNGEFHSFDLRDLMLFALLLLDPETLDMKVSAEASHLATKAFRSLFPDPDAAKLKEWTRDARYKDWEHRPLNNRLDNVLQKTDASPEIMWLAADKILDPTFKKRQAGPFSISVADPISKMLSLPDRQNAPKAESPSPPTNKSIRPTKGMSDYFGGDPTNRFIAFGTKYRDVRVNGKDPGQRDYFSWYYDKHIRDYTEGFAPELIEFLKNTYGAGTEAEGNSGVPSARPTRPSKAVEENQVVAPKDAGFNLSLFRVHRLNEADLIRTALKEIASKIDRAVLDDQKQDVIHIEGVGSGDEAAGQRLGVKLRLRQSRNGDKQFLQITPTAGQIKNRPGPGFLLSYSDAQRLINKAVGAVSWVNQEGASYLDFEQGGQFSQSGCQNTKVASNQRLSEILKGLPLAIVAGTPDVEPAVSSWKDAISKSGAVQVVPVDEASAQIVIVPENCADRELDSVRERFDRAGTPWKVVNPDPRYKDWNVLLGIASRLGRSHGSAAHDNIASPNTWFLGIDLGHQKGVGSTIAATLVDHQGKLLAWTRGPNRGLSERATAERISEESMRSLLRTLLDEFSLSSDWSGARFVIHRDGRTLEDVDTMCEFLTLAFGIRHVDWLDVDKQRAPLFFIDPNADTGQFVVAVDDDGQEEMWLRTAPGRAGRYSRPLCLVPRACGSDIISLGLEVFKLSNVLTQDYEMKNKLPITTYFADGFSSTGEKRVKFWGYNELRRPRVVKC